MVRDGMSYRKLLHLTSGSRRRGTPATMHPPRVSVIICVYNRAVQVISCLESPLLLEGDDIEIVVVDDGSTDGTAASVESWIAKRDSAETVRLVRRPNGGAAAARTTGLAAVEDSPYVAFLDSDDLWLPHKLAVQVAAATAAGDAIIHTRERWLRDGRVVSQRGQRHRRSGDLFADSLRKCVIGPSTVLLRREVFEAAGGFREDLEIAEDYELWLRLTARHPVGYVERESVIKRAGHGDQLSERYGHIELFRLCALRDLLERADRRHFTPPQRAAAAAELARKARIYAAGCRKRGRTAEAARYDALAHRWSARPGNGADAPEAAGRR